mgnify:CR=1 FL=1
MNATAHDESRRPFYFDPRKIPQRDEVIDVDVCVYGNAAAAVLTAVEVLRRGRSVVLVAPAAELGGMTTGGLGWTDVGRSEAIGGIASEFYEQIGRRYGEAVRYRFEPGVAAAALAEMIDEAGLDVRRDGFIKSVVVEHQRVREARFHGGLTVRGRMFIDASYEGDLMAMAGVPFAVGRESNATYGETLNGQQVSKKHQFEHPVDPYRRPGVPASGLLPRIDPEPVSEDGDSRIQAFNFRMCLTDDPANRVAFPKPSGYDPIEYELLARYLATGWNEVFRKFDRVTETKTDTNNHGAVSTDFIGANHAWPTASHAQREVIFQQHVTYQQGLMWFLANDTRVPAKIREAMNAWGLAADEFAATGHWPHQLYVRESRRMLGDYVVTEHDCLHGRRADEPIALASYTMDAHNARRIVVDGRVLNEGDVQEIPPSPFPVPYRAVVPPVGSVQNLLVPVCLSASHIAFGSVRMEPVFMELGQAAAIAACLSVEEGCSLQSLDYAALRGELSTAGAVIQTPSTDAVLL